MRNDTRSRIFNRSVTLYVVGIVAAFNPVPSLADATLPPPAQHQNAGFPSEQALRQKGYDPKTGIWKVEAKNTGKPTVSSSGGTITGSSGQRVTVTDAYGNRASTNTHITQRVSGGRLQTAANTVIVGNAVGSSYSQNVDRYGPRIAEDLRKGNYGSAANNAVLGVLETIDGSLGGVISATSRLGQYLGFDNWGTPQQYRDAGDRFYKWQMQKEQSGQLGEAIVAAAAAKAAKGAAAAAAAEPSGWTTEGKKLAEAARQKDGSYKQLFLRRIDVDNGSNVKPWRQDGVAWQIDTHNGIYNWENIQYAKRWLKSPLSLPKEAGDSYSVSGSYYQPITSDKELEAALQKVGSKAPKDIDKIKKDMMLTDKEILDILKRMLESQQTNHNELMNQLAKMGSIVPDSTTSTEFTPTTTTTAPYTPTGSNMPQQTQITINRDGSITTTVIPRPDLVPNSPQAPTRTALIPNKPSTPTTPTTPTSPTTPTTPAAPTEPTSPTSPTAPTTPQNPSGEQQNQDLCTKNPAAPQCTGENTAYEDLGIPEQSIDLNGLKPLNVFQNDGVCPAPVQVQMGAMGTLEFSYDGLCQTLRMIRPILIIGTIIMCGWFAYNAIKEL